MPDMQGRRCLVIFNPVSGRRRHHVLDAVLDALGRSGIAAELRPTRRPGDATEIARRATLAEWHAVLVAGGDGTVAEVVEGLIGRTDAPPLGLIPLGTANVLAAELGLPGSPEALARLLASGTRRTIRVGRANGRAFTLMAGIGFDATVVAGVGPVLKRILGKGAYVIAGLIAWLRYRPIRFEVVVDGVRHVGFSVVVAKARHYGGRFVLAAAADLAADQVQVILFQGGRRWDLLRYAWALARGEISRLGDVRAVAARRVEIAGPVGMPVQIDGDAKAALPLTIILDDNELTIIGQQPTKI
ncbi:MAG: diacylglycerol kinase family lipid kinase [Alphaproteobacteria bacterium]|nr:diacylglycerol kinase family lipid kinase [Alphaproteobacteria bacterium]